jgi:uncharacterized protein YdhG (YjbR/CyaY superfamily)
MRFLSSRFVVLFWAYPGLKPRVCGDFAIQHIAEPMDKPKTFDEYATAFPAETRRILEEIRATVRQAVPEAEEVISYDMPAFRLGGKTLIYFAAWKKHIGFYPLSEKVASAVPELSAFKGTKDSAHFPLNKPMPLELISRMTEARRREVG